MTFHRFVFNWLSHLPDKTSQLFILLLNMQNWLSFSNIHGLQKKTMGITDFSKICYCYLVILNQKKNEDMLPSHDVLSMIDNLITPLQHDRSIRLIMAGGVL